MNQACCTSCGYCCLKDGRPEKYRIVRERAEEVAYLIKNLCPDSREKSSAIDKLKEVVDLVHASITNPVCQKRV